MLAKIWLNCALLFGTWVTMPLSHCVEEQELSTPTSVSTFQREIGEMYIMAAEFKEREINKCLHKAKLVKTKEYWFWVPERDFNRYIDTAYYLKDIETAYEVRNYYLGKAETYNVKRLTKCLIDRNLLCRYYLKIDELYEQFDAIEIPLENNPWRFLSGVLQQPAFLKRLL